MDTIALQEELTRHRGQLLETMARCERLRERLQNELAVKAHQGENFEAMRPLHDEITGTARAYWSAYGRVALIDQVLETFRGRRDRLTFDDTAEPVRAAAETLNPWARCAEETCPPFPPWV